MHQDQLTLVRVCASRLLFQGLLLDLLAGLAPAPSAAWGEARNYSVSLVLSAAPQPSEGSGAEAAAAGAAAVYPDNLPWALGADSEKPDEPAAVAQVA